MAKGGPRTTGQSSGTSKQHASATISVDDDDFSKPFAAEVAAAKLAFRTASIGVKGAAMRVQQAVDDLADLRTFSNTVQQHLDHATFTTLPRIVRRTANQPQRLHRLNVGPFIGAFLVSADGQSVIALSFRRLPHDFGADISALLMRYAAQSDDD